MKKITALLAILSMIIYSCKKDPQTIQAPAYVIPCLPANLQTGVIAFYPFSNGSINDFSGHNHHLVNTTTAHSTPDRNGNSNCAFEFNNPYNSTTATEFLTTSNTTFLNGLTQFSISLWYEPLDTVRGAGDFEALVNRGMGVSCPDRMGQWSIALYDCRKAVFARQNSVWDNNIITNPFDCQQEIITRTGSWHHIAATFDQATNQMKIYRDGILQATSNGPANCGSGTPSVQDLGDLFLGKWYKGRLDDIILYNKTLDQAEVNELNSMGTCCSSK